MSKQQPYPPCTMNPMTEKVYTRHKWVIKDALRVRRNSDGDPVTLYRVVCSRCGINDPRSPTH